MRRRCEGALVHPRLFSMDGCVERHVQCARRGAAQGQQADHYDELFQSCLTFVTYKVIHNALTTDLRAFASFLRNLVSEHPSLLRSPSPTQPEPNFRGFR
jgi:hypothetical protein